MPTENIIININTTHWISGTNRFRFTFSQPLDLKNKKSELFLYQYSIYNSTYNISSKLGNNTYSVKWIDGITYNYTIPDGYYSFDQLNSVLKYNMIKDSMYLVSTTDTTKQLFYIAVSANTTNYSAEISINYFPNSLPTGYEKPVGSTWNIPASNTYPQLMLSTGLRTLFGFTSQLSFPTSQTVSNPARNLSFLSDSYPIISPIFNYTILCNMVNSKVSQVPTHLYSIPLTASFGSLLTNTALNVKGVTVNPTVYNFIELQFTDQYYNSLLLKDWEMNISLILSIEDIDDGKK